MPKPEDLLTSISSFPYIDAVKKEDFTAKDARVYAKNAMDVRRSTTKKTKKIRERSSRKHRWAGQTA